MSKLMVFCFILLTPCPMKINMETSYDGERMPHNVQVLSMGVVKQRHIRDVPSKPSKLTGTVQSNSKIFLTWAPPPINSGPTTYIIKVKRNDSVTTNAEQSIKVEGYLTTNHMVKGLSSSTVYVFTIMAQTSSGNSSETRSEPTRTWDERPGRVQNLTVTQWTANSILLQWKQPLHVNGRGHLTAYVVYVYPNEDNICTAIKAFVYRKNDFRWNKTDSVCQLPNDTDIEKKTQLLTDHITLNVTNLDPYVKYDIMVKAYNTFGPGEQFQITKKTSIDVPSEPRYFTGKVQSNSDIFLTWEPPLINPGPTKYTIGVKRNDSKSSGDEQRINLVGYTNTSYLVRGLSSSTLYTFTIMALTSSGNSSETVSEPIRTWDERPDRVLDLDVINKTANSMLLQWKQPLHVNGRGHLTAYVVYIRLNDSNKDNHSCITIEAVVYIDEDFQRINSDSFCQLSAEENIDLEKSLPSDPITLNVTNLDTYVAYDIMVIAYNTFGPGEPFQITQTTAIGIPSEPSHLTGTVQSNSEIFLTWNPPPINPGPTTYIIGVKQNDSVTPDVEQSIKVVGYTNTSYLVSGLRSSTVYMFTLVAQTSAGNSSETVSEPIRTWNKTPDKVQSLMVLRKTNDSITLQWKKPLHINGRGVLTAFVVYVRSNDTNMTGSQLCTTARAIVYNNTEIQVTQNPDEHQDKSLDVFCQVREGSLIEDKRPLPTSLITLSLQNLAAYVRYDIMVTTYNTFGPGTPALITTTTDMALQCLYPKHRVLRIVWAPATRASGQVAFDVNVNESKLPRDIYRGSLEFYNIFSTANSSVEIKRIIRPYWTYIVSVTPTTSDGDRLPEQVIDCVTPNFGEASGPVQSFNVGSVPRNVYLARVTFKCPKIEERHGAIQRILIEADTEQSHLEEFVESRQPRIQTRDPGINCGGLYQKDISITPDVMYTFQVRVKLVNLTTLGEPVFRNFSTTIRPPPPMHNVLSQGNMNATQESDLDRESSFTVQLCKRCILNSSNGNIIHVGMIVCPDADCDASFNDTRDRTWKHAHAIDFNMSYVSTGVDWVNTINDSRTNAVIYTVGADKNCKKVLSGYCNGPLPSNRQFWVKVFSCTKAGCTSSDTSGPFTTAGRTGVSTNDSSKVPLIAGVVAGVVAFVIIIVIIIVIIWKRRGKLQKQYSRRNLVISQPDRDIPLQAVRIDMNQKLNSSIQAPNVKTDTNPTSSMKRPIVIGNFESSLHQFTNDVLLLNREFLDLDKLSPVHDMEEGSRPENKSANRMSHNIPFDRCRVKLHTDDSLEDIHEYINASFIPGFNEPKLYIATQGPIQKTIGDFWRMVWEQKVFVVAMLSEFQEKDKKSSVRVSRYLPHDGETFSHQYGNIIITKTHKVDKVNWEVRILKLSDAVTKKCRFVKHFLFKTWSEPDADIRPIYLIDFIKTVQQEVILQPQSPLVVHCSDGIGRTGTFLAIDYLNDYLEGLAQNAMDENDFLQRKVDIFETVLNLRNYRKMLVQTRAQYSFIYEAVLVLINDKIENWNCRYNYYEVGEDEDIYQVVDDEDRGVGQRAGNNIPPTYKARTSCGNASLYENETSINPGNDTEEDNDSIYELVVYRPDNHTTVV